jgi:hypothetical protein
MPPGQAVLAVDERLRYGPLKAGYHGGASPAEAVVAVAVLVPGTIPDQADLRLAPPQQPAWWVDPVRLPDGPLSAPRRGPGSAAVPGGRLARPGAVDPRLRGPADGAATLFDLPGVPASVPERAPAAGTDQLAGEVTGSAVYAAQRKIAGRLSVADERVRDLLAALLAAPGSRLAPVQAASVLAVAPAMLRGATLHVQRLLNVEGYPVLRIDEDGATVILDEPLLREQFGVRS